jgi:hypothetical protein
MGSEGARASNHGSTATAADHDHAATWGRQARPSPLLCFLSKSPEEPQSEREERRGGTE